MGWLSGESDREPVFGLFLESTDDLAARTADRWSLGSDLRKPTHLSFERWCSIISKGTTWHKWRGTNGGSSPFSSQEDDDEDELSEAIGCCVHIYSVLHSLLFACECESRLLHFSQSVKSERTLGARRRTNTKLLSCHPHNHHHHHHLQSMDLA